MSFTRNPTLTIAGVAGVPDELLVVVVAAAVASVVVVESPDSVIDVEGAT